MQQPGADAGVDRALAMLTGWVRTGDCLRACYELPTFAATVVLAESIAAAAARLDHRPEWTVRDRQLEVATTAGSGGLSLADVALASHVHRLAAAAGAKALPADSFRGGGGTWVQPGHYYSPLTDRAEIEADAERLFAPGLRELAGIDLRLPQQMQLARTLSGFHGEADFPTQPLPDRRYCLANEFFTGADAFAYYALLRHLRPARVVEVGAGWSTAVLFDTDERFLGSSIRCTVIEPFPDRVLKLLRPDDLARTQLLQRRLQDVPLAEFGALAENDILFIDSSHVAKTGSDVLHALFAVLPSLRSGVWVHVHDVHANFEYPADWIREGRSWNESYFLRAFLMHNREWAIELHGATLAEHAPAELMQLMPGIGTNAGGSLWLRKL